MKDCFKIFQNSESISLNWKGNYNKQHKCKRKNQINFSGENPSNEKYFLSVTIEIK